jgi:tRNA threonylcarbamoyl adenosine modification protein YeaZ
MKVLAIDTSANLCAACVKDTGELGRAVRNLGKGHAEHLMAVIDEALSAAATTYAELELIAVAVGPGSFTGIRVGVAAARGLALALKIPSVAVTTLDLSDYWEYRRLLELIDLLGDGAMVQRFVALGSGSADPDVREAAKDFERP